MEFVFDIDFDIDIEQRTWEDLTPTISFDGEISCSSDHDLSGASHHSYEAEMEMVADVLMSDDDADLSIYLDPLTTLSEEKAIPEDFVDTLLRDEVALSGEDSCSIDRGDSKDIVADALMSALYDENDTCTSDECPSTPLSTATSGVWSGEAMSPWSSPASPATCTTQTPYISETLASRHSFTQPQSAQQQNPVGGYAATMSSTPIDHFLANWLAQQLTTTKDASHPGYSRSSNKPPESYLALIAKAILSLPSRRALLSDIYSFCLDNYGHFRTAPTTWKNAVRHNLCVNECFVKNGRAPQGRGYYWSIHPACLQSFLCGDFRRKEARQLAVDMNKLRHSQQAVVYTHYL